MDRRDWLGAWALLLLCAFVGLGMVALAAVAGGSEGFGLRATRGFVFAGVLVMGWGYALFRELVEDERRWQARRRTPAWQEAWAQDKRAMGLD